MTRVIQELGALSGPVVVFGGAYSNLQATRALLKWAGDTGISGDQMICTGDIIAYCADPAAVTDLLLGQVALIKGNVEQSLASGQADCGCGFAEGSTCDLASVAWFEHVEAALSHRRAEFATLPDWIVFDHMDHRYVVVHGGASDVARFLWPTDPDEVFASEISLIEAEIGPVDTVVSGHSGIPFDRHIAQHRWINAGVIGMPPHDGAPDTRFCLLGDTGPQIHRLSYDWCGAQSALTSAGLTQGYETALETGYWPSEDILPAALRVVRTDQPADDALKPAL